LDKEISALKRERESASLRKKFEDAKKLEARIQKLEKQRSETVTRWRKEKVLPLLKSSGCTLLKLSPNHGHSSYRLNSREKEKLLKMKERLHERIIGQEEAVNAVSDAVLRSRAV